MFYAWIPLFSYMVTNLGQMPAAAALRLLRLRLRLRLEILVADRGTGWTDVELKSLHPFYKLFENLKFLFGFVNFTM